ncbi:MAG: TetR/AcrR family transcriptional regulator [Actinomycetota bacterium]|nr:TetR/AcrR family transcriptional regulator [Actinomycetota bacterium]
MSSTPGRSPARTNRRGLRSREEILQVALRVMSEHGFTATSLSLLRRESKLPSSSIYHHFGSKAELLAAVVERGADQYSQDLAIMSDCIASTDPRESIRVWLVRDAELFVKHEQFFRMVILLFLTNEVPIAAQTAAQIRVGARSRFRSNLEAAFAYAGSDVAGKVADALTDFALTASEGTLLMSRATGIDVSRLSLERLADALACSGMRMVEQLQASIHG